MNRFSLQKCFRGSIIFGLSSVVASSVSFAGDWPQWMGANRDATVSGFVAPANWPKELKKQWSTEVGNGVGTPSLVGNRLYLFARKGDEEVACCLNADTGKEIWQYKYATQGAGGPLQSFPGPRTSPKVVDGKVIVYGVRGKLTCLDAAAGKVIWRNAEPENTSTRVLYCLS